MSTFAPSILVVFAISGVSFWHRLPLRGVMRKALSVGEGSIVSNSSRSDLCFYTKAPVHQELDTASSNRECNLLMQLLHTRANKRNSHDGFRLIITGLLAFRLMFLKKVPLHYLYANYTAILRIPGKKTSTRTSSPSIRQ